MNIFILCVFLTVYLNEVNGKNFREKSKKILDSLISESEPLTFDPKFHDEMSKIQTRIYKIEDEIDSFIKKGSKDFLDFKRSYSELVRNITNKFLVGITYTNTIRGIDKTYCLQNGINNMLLARNKTIEQCKMECIKPKRKEFKKIFHLYQNDAQLALESTFETPDILIGHQSVNESINFAVTLVDELAKNVDDLQPSGNYLVSTAINETIHCCGEMSIKLYSNLANLTRQMSHCIRNEKKKFLVEKI